jgi:type VI secretion system protein ImpJ
MRFLSRVVWWEGMSLGPHQFQTQNRYFEDSIQFATSLVHFAPYGLLGFRPDPEALRNGTLSLLHARGLFPDGLAFDMPDCDALPPTRRIADLFPPTRDGVVVSLAVPQRSDGGRNCALNGDSAGARYVAESRTFADESSGGDERPVRVGRKNFALLLDVEPSAGLATLPLARIVRDGAGHYVLDANFVPPCLQIAASERLMLLLRQLIEILDEKSAVIGQGPGKTRSTDFGTREIANFWLLHAINSALAPLRHMWTSKRAHPEELFLELSRLGGALCTFGLDSHPRTLPAYQHETLGECFDALNRHIREHLEIIVPTSYLSIRLQKIAESFYEGEIEDTRCFGRSRWLFGIQSPAGEAEVITRTPATGQNLFQPFRR